MVKRLAALAAVLLAGCGHLAPPPPAPVPVRLIALNDFHGHLQSPGRFGTDNLLPAAQRPEVGGADAIAAQVAQLKAGQRNSAVVAAGDLIGASPLVSALFHDEPAVEALNRIGLEFSSVGNHEFDRGASELLRLQRGGCRALGDARDADSCRGAQAGTPVPFEGARFQWLSANVRARESGAPLLPPYGIKTFDGIPVAFIGMTLQGTPRIVAPRGVAGLAFDDEADTVAALVPQLRARGVEAIVVLLHEGGVQTGPRAALNACEGLLAGSPLAHIVARLDDAVDLVISGHTHAAYNCRLPNRAGRLVPVTSASAFGRVLTRIDLTLDPRTRDVIEVQAENQLVERAALAPAAAVRALVDAYAALAAPLAQQVVGAIAADLPAQPSDAACNMPAGELVADAQLAATAAPAPAAADLALMNRGGVRQPGFRLVSDALGAGRITYGDAFTAQPFGNSLVTQTFTAAQLRALLEQQFAGCGGQAAGATRLLIPSANFSFTWDGARACGERIRSATLRRSGRVETLIDDGRVLQPQAPLRITTNSFLADGGDGFSLLTQGREAIGGGQDLDALIAYLAPSRPPAAPLVLVRDPAAPRLRRIGGAVCPQGADTNP